MKAVRVDIHDELISFSIKEGQKLNVIVVDYVSFEIKTKFEQSKVETLDICSEFCGNQTTWVQSG